MVCTCVDVAAVVLVEAAYVDGELRVGVEEAGVPVAWIVAKNAFEVGAEPEDSFVVLEDGLHDGVVQQAVDRGGEFFPVVPLAEAVDAAGVFAYPYGSVLAGQQAEGYFSPERFFLVLPRTVAPQGEERGQVGQAVDAVALVSDPDVAEAVGQERPGVDAVQFV